MKKPTVADCLAEIRRLSAENERLNRLVQSRRPELAALRSLATFVRDELFNLPMKLERLQKDVDAALGTNDDLPTFDEITGCLSDGRERVYEALKPFDSADAAPKKDQP